MLLLTPTLPPQPQQYIYFIHKRAVYEISQNFHKLFYLRIYYMKTARQNWQFHTLGPHRNLLVHTKNILISSRNFVDSSINTAAIYVNI